MKKIEPLLWAKRLLVYLLGLFFMAAGVVFSVKSGLGVSPVTGQADVLNDSTWSDNYGTYESNLRSLEKLIASAENHDITVVGVTFPISPYYKKTGAYGRHGMRRSHGIKLIDYLKDLDQSHSNFILMDENKLGDHDYTNDMALDYDHLNKWGAEQISRRIDSLLNTLE